LLFSILLLQALCGQSSPISNTHQRYRPAPGLGDGHGGVVDPSLLEQDDNMDVQSLLESLKEQFLQTFNLSGLGPPPLPPEGTREEPPEYMMELYNRFANDRTAMPTANIIRSLNNEGNDNAWLIIYIYTFVAMFIEYIHDVFDLNIICISQRTSCVYLNTF